MTLSHSTKRSVNLTISLLCLATVMAGPDARADVQSLPAPLTDTDFLWDGNPDPALVILGQNLFFDPILSGNRNISCGTCHDPALGTGDGLALGIGEGGVGAGHERKTQDGVIGRVPRNAQPLYNIGARSYTRMFHDGRLEPDDQRTFQSGFWSPAREHLPAGLHNALTAQAMFPVLSPVEMAGQKGENLIATAVAEDRITDAWDLIAERLSGVPEYQRLFEEAFGPDQITFSQAAKALAAFQSVAFRSEGSPFHRALASSDFSVFSDSARRGMDLFFGSAGCAECHNGPLLTDHEFHAIAMPQIGPGKGHGRDTSFWRATGFMDRVEDEGRYRVTFEVEDLFRFRTPSLVNVALTGPWGHSGAYDTLEDVVRHHAVPLESLEAYDMPRLQRIDDVIEQTGSGSVLIFRPLNPARRTAFDARDGFVHNSERLRSRIAEANDLAPKPMGDTEISDIVSFLNALTDPTMIDLSALIPDSVPSGLSPQPKRASSIRQTNAVRFQNVDQPTDFPVRDVGVQNTAP